MRYLFVLLLMSGCATTEKGWDKPGATQEEFVQDRGQCVAQAFAAITPFQQQMILVGCMQGKGWAWVEREREVHVQATPTSSREAYRVCNDDAERISGSKNVYNDSFRTAYDSCMRGK